MLVAKNLGYDSKTERSEPLDSLDLMAQVVIYRLVVFLVGIDHFGANKVISVLNFLFCLRTFILARFLIIFGEM